MPRNSRKATGGNVRRLIIRERGDIRDRLLREAVEADYAPPELSREYLDRLQADIDAKLGPIEFRTVSRAKW